MKKGKFLNLMSRKLFFLIHTLEFGSHFVILFVYSQKKLKWLHFFKVWVKKFDLIKVTDYFFPNICPEQV